MVLVKNLNQPDNPTPLCLKWRIPLATYEYFYLSINFKIHSRCERERKFKLSNLFKTDIKCLHLQFTFLSFILHLSLPIFILALLLVCMPVLHKWPWLFLLGDSAIYLTISELNAGRTKDPQGTCTVSSLEYEFLIAGK